MKLDKMPEMQNYCKRFSDAPYLKLGLVNVLTADANLFGNKSLRALLQNLELFSIFLIINGNLSFEEIFTAFIIIIGNNNRMSISRNVSSTLRKDTYNISKILNSITMNSDNESFSYGDLGNEFHLNSAECVAHFWICLSMLHTESSLNNNSRLLEFIARLKSSIVAGVAFGMGSPGYIPPMSVAQMDNVEESLIKKLQMLDEFSQTVHTSTLNTEDDSMTLKMGELHI